MLSVDRPSTECRPITIDQLSANYRRSVGERKAISAETHLERLSTVSRPSVDPLSTAMSTDCRPTIDRVSTDCRPSIDRLSTEYRPLHRPISRSTLPTVNKIVRFSPFLNPYLPEFSDPLNPEKCVTLF